MEGALGAAAREMLHGIASWHGGLVARGETSKAICARARMAPNREAFARDTRPLGLS